MKALVVSDLHVEFQRDEGKALISKLSPADAIFIAGDLSIAEIVPRVLPLLCKKYSHVFYVSGNHEYYHSAPKEVEVLRRKMQTKFDNLHWLENETHELDGVKIHGTTLWFPYDQYNILHQNNMSDFSVIGYDTDPFIPWVYDKNEEAVRFLQSSVGAGDIVITHHLPLRFSIHPDFENSILNCFYLCEMAGDILKNQSPSLWVHGHTHYSFDYRWGNTKVLCNPFGYMGSGVYDGNESFDGNLLVEI